MLTRTDAPLELHSDDGELSARFAPGAGMLGCSLRHRGEELLGAAGIPILHPWANRLGGWRYEVGGRRVALDRHSPLIATDGNGLPIHGTLMGSKLWEVEGTDDGLTAQLDYGADDELLAAFPFPHLLQLAIRLRGRTVEVRTTVIATGPDAVPLAFGFHPYLRLPGVPRAAWEVTLPERDELVLGADQLPTGETLHRPGERGRLGARTFDHLFRPHRSPARFALAGGGRHVVVEMGAGYPFAQVFAPRTEDVVCFEPMTAPVNALATGHDLRFAAPRADVTFRVTVTLEA
jgi:galactose mutarotase-like enzyme